MHDDRPNRPVVVATSSGRVEGRAVRTLHGEVVCFRGLPFAAAGAERRFRPPGPAPTWTGVRAAHQPAPTAPQNPDPMLAVRGLPQPVWAEDGCLAATVWAPATPGGQRPVMVWVHGGAYLGGSTSAALADGAALAASGDVVVVALGYRLGAFGFLHLAGHLGDEECGDAGNLGILDLVAGLRWVRENATAFGGDPDNVTVFGESAGAAAVATLLATPSARGLFRRAVMQSGTAERARTTDAASEMTERFLRAGGLSVGDVRQLRDWPAERILDAQRMLVEDVARETIGVPLPFQPVVDGRALTALPLDAIRQGAASDVDLIAGTNLNESSFSTAFLPPAARTDEALAAMLARLEAQHVPGQDYRAALDEALGRPSTTLEAVEALLTDVQYRQPTRRILDARAGAPARTFAYLLTWPSPAMGGMLGTPHALDIPFVFGTTALTEAADLLGSSPPEGLATAMGRAWASFARTGIPESDPPGWPPYGPDRRTMRWDAEPAVVADPRAALRELWERADGLTA